MKTIPVLLTLFALPILLASCAEAPAEAPQPTPFSASRPMTAAPTCAPSVVPTAVPPVTPSVVPTAVPTAVPTVDTPPGKGIPICDSVHAEYGGEAAAAFDGDVTTCWRSASPGNGGDDAWIGMRWNESVTFDTVILAWDAAHPAKDGFKVQISDDGETWRDVAFHSVRTGEETDDFQTDTVTFDAVNAKAVRILCQRAYVVPDGRAYEGNVKEYPSCREMRIVDSARESTVSP